MKNFSKVSVGAEARTELHEKLGLTGAEVSINNLPACASVPFVHSHKKNEEIYCIVSGSGKMVVDGEDIELKTGDWLRIAPSAKRQMFAAKDSPVSYICIQVKENSIGTFTADDAIIVS